MCDLFPLKYDMIDIEQDDSDTGKAITACTLGFTLNVDGVLHQAVYTSLAKGMY
jgi:hypothetical protein